MVHMATTGSVAAAPEQRVELQVPPAGPFMLLAARGARAVSEQVLPAEWGSRELDSPFDIGFEIGRSPGHGLCPN